ncbi:oxidoreductase [Coprinopsis sp. MPI-PUGE-AT-0042]|nr:oxidoreductase [Coprinopsis sp. MPI-PUGE-AT-0042]
MAPPNTSKMTYVNLGKSGLKVSKIILGAMTYGSSKWQDWVLDEEESTKHIKTAYDAGINAFDTADVYSNGLSEVVLGKAIRQHNLPREEIVVMTKLYCPVGKQDDPVSVLVRGRAADDLGFVNQHGLSRKHIFAGVKASLERLQLDYVDLLQCHRFDYDTPIEETMQALHDVVKAGYVRYIGMSSCWAYQFHAMQDYAINNNLTPFISMQNHYNLVYREEEREMFPTLKHFNVGAIPWSPLARGLTTRPIVSGTTRGDSDGVLKGYNSGEGTKKIISAIESIATKRGVSMAQVSLAWVMSRPGVTAPIVGTSSLDNLHDLLGAVDLKLTDEEIKQLSDPYEAQAAFGHA